MTALPPGHCHAGTPWVDECLAMVVLPELALVRTSPIPARISRGSTSGTCWA
ncbi:MAG: hypothetical protein J2P19_23330 [Pseudonocardia sp.]|nr:hypothetical protein [Pseudonocardia sp.]